jgi:hypothetical protein
MAKKKEIGENDLGIDLNFDIGNFDIPKTDLGELGEYLETGTYNEETRYTMPCLYKVPEDFVLYDNAVKLARELRLDKGERADAFVSGNFIFGDFLEAYLTTHRAKAKKMTITTLSLSQNNIDSLHNLMEGGYIGELNLIVSVYFWAHEIHQLIPYIYRQLDINDRFQLCVGGIHTKTTQFETMGGRKIIIHGSANLRSSGSVEQFTIEENERLYDFYDEVFTRIIEKYKTINKPVRNNALWDEITRKRFNN